MANPPTARPLTNGKKRRGRPPNVGRKPPPATPANGAEPWESRLALLHADVRRMEAAFNRARAGDAADNHDFVRNAVEVLRRDFATFASRFNVTVEAAHHNAEQDTKRLTAIETAINALMAAVGNTQKLAAENRTLRDHLITIITGVAARPAE